jgi:hypothetical protein
MVSEFSPGGCVEMDNCCAALRQPLPLPSFDDCSFGQPNNGEGVNCAAA